MQVGLATTLAGEAYPELDAGMSSARKPADELPVPKPISFFHAISNDMVLVGQWQGHSALVSSAVTCCLLCAQMRKCRV